MAQDRRPPETPAGSPVGQPRDLIVDVYGAYLRALGGWISIADTIRLLADLGVDEQSVRASISRLKRRGRVVREVRRNVVGYAVRPGPPAPGGGRPAHLPRLPAGRPRRRLGRGDVQRPERERANRYLIRSRLQWLGFGMQGTGAWIAPRRLAEDAGQMLERLGLTAYADVFAAHYRGFGELRDLVARAWDLDELRALYSEFLAARVPVP